ncbi:hypothetical protein Tco_0652719 [Tanacetum coccineum]|uniref:Uncharacterized protein n=1 Tax=Tanacetum coccineum TaxID=301880 RepID=A0ABQ4WYT1_9ASTR
MMPHAVKILDWGDLMTYNRYSRPLGLGRTLTLGLWPNQADSKHNGPKLSLESHWPRPGYNKTDADWSQATPTSHQRIKVSEQVVVSEYLGNEQEAIQDRVDEALDNEEAVAQDSVDEHFDTAQDVVQDMVYEHFETEHDVVFHRHQSDCAYGMLYFYGPRL